jgi:transcriptional regulator of acetoin/glycerol metabolism
MVVLDRVSQGRSGVTTQRETDEDRGERSLGPSSCTLVLLHGQVRGGCRRFTVGTQPVQLGREPAGEHSIELDDSRASRRHAEIEWSEIERAHWIRDVGSRNGVYLSGAQVARELLRVGDILRIGKTVFWVTALGSRDPDIVPLPPPFVGASESLRRSVNTALRVSESATPVLILGPTGTGKELVAEAIHQASRRPGPLVPVNCAALRNDALGGDGPAHDLGSCAGLLRAAQAGTLLLDEVAELALDIQAKLLRVFDASLLRAPGAMAETHVDVRVIASSNRDLAAEVVAGRFRGDLYARLSESVVRLDPLCDRPEDLMPLWRHFVAEIGRGATLELSGAALEAMAVYAWPFNVRELRQLARGALLVKAPGTELSVDDLPAAMRVTQRTRSPRLSELVATPSAIDRGKVPGARQLHQLLEEFHGNVKDVAAFLGKDRKQVYRWLRRDQIDPGVYRS